VAVNLMRAGALAALAVTPQPRPSPWPSSTRCFSYSAPEKPSRTPRWGPSSRH
jgi:hypothetical protein